MRTRNSSLRETSAAVVAALLVFSACCGDEIGSAASGIAPETAPPVSTIGTTSSSAPSTTSTTAAAGPLWEIGKTVLVAADNGVYQIGTTGDVTLLVEGTVAYAVDDTEGGLLFQVNRGRNWDDKDRWSTIVWWIPRGASTPQELIVPTPGVGHLLSLHDAYRAGDGFAVLYTRHEGATPDEMTDRLLRFEVPAREVTELYSQGAFEHGYGQVSTNGELIAGVWFQQVGSGCFIYDLDGQPTDLVPTEASDPMLEDYVGGCRLSPNGNQLTFVTQQHQDNQHVSTFVHVWDLNTDTEMARFVVPARDGVPRDIDVTATKAVASFIDEDQQQTLVFDLDAPEADPIALPVAGRARFVNTPIDIGAAVPSPGFATSTTSPPLPFVLTADGLGVVSFGDPVDEAMAVLTEHFGAPTHDELYESPFEVPSGWQGDDRGPEACHWGAQGYRCFDYVRFVWWENIGVWVIFSDLETNREATPGDDDYVVQVPPSFQGYMYAGGDQSPLLYTVDGITIGSTTANLLSLGPLVSFAWSPCGNVVEFTIADKEETSEHLIRGSLDDHDFEAYEGTGLPNQNAAVRSLSAGQHGSC